MSRPALLLIVFLLACSTTALPDQSPTGCAAQADHHVTGLTFDGAYLVGVDHRNHAERATEAGYMCTAALHSYESHSVWGFPSDDTDHVWNYTLHDHRIGIVPGRELNIDVAVTLEELAASQGISYTSVESLFATVVHHETNHHLIMSAVDCYDLTWWGGWGWLWNGYATFSESLYNVSEMHRADSSFYENAAATNAYMRAPNRPLNALAHETALLHGYLYAHDGGMSFVHILVELAHGDCAGGEALPRGVAYLDAAVAATPGTHDTFEAAFVDFALDVVKRENLTWGPPGADTVDWSLWLDPVRRTAWPLPVVDGTVQPWAFEVLDAPCRGGYDITLLADDGISGFLLVRDGTVWHETAFQDAVQVPAGNHDDVAVVLVAPSYTAVEYTLVKGFVPVRVPGDAAAP